VAGENEPKGGDVEKWQVFGADRTTGDPVETTVEAITEAEATRLAGRTMLIERVTVVAPAPVAPAAHAPRKVPDYAAITTGAALINLAGLVLIAVGLLATGVAAAAAAGLLGRTLEVAPGPLLVAGLTGLVYGILCRFGASLGLAVRDIAINSFRVIGLMSVLGLIGAGPATRPATRPTGEETEATIAQRRADVARVEADVVRGQARIKALRAELARQDEAIRDLKARIDKRIGQPASQPATKPASRESDRSKDVIRRPSDLIPYLPADAQPKGGL
jgi:hypothetical protein